MATQKKFEFRNGVLVRIPDAASSSASAATAVGVASTAGKPGVVPPTVIPIAMVCSADELATASEVTQAQGVATTVPVATQAAIEGFYNPDFVNQYHATAATSGEGILEHLGSIFASLEIPLGVLSKLLVLNKYRLNFIIDDSGSMRSQTDSDKYQAGPFVLNRFKKSGVELYSPMTRWEEVEDRLHTMMEVLAYVPTGIITICFLNRPNVVHLDRTGKEPATFLQQSHLDIEKLFVAQPDGGTPIYASLDRAFRSSAGPTMHYLFTDGEPSDADTHRVTKLVLERPNPIQNPVTFVSCTGDDQATEWMKELDDAGPMLAEVDDYEDEKREVLSKQGPVLPYTRGLWLMSLIVGAINPDDLDGLDDSEPISKYTLDNLMGRILTAQEYSQYFSNHPKASSYRLKYSQFANEKKSTREILGLPAPGTKPPPKKSFFGLF